jgi:hypothetical protein
MLNLIGLLQVEDVVRLVVVTLGCFLIYASYKKCDKDNKKLKVIVRLLAVVALATILKAFYKGNFAISGLDYFSNAAIVVILHILVIAATTQLKANCAKLPKKHHKSSHSSNSCATSSGWSCSSSSCSTSKPCTCSSSDTFDRSACGEKKSNKSCKKCGSSSSSSSCSSISCSW